jgi:hypothetical protein
VLLLLLWGRGLLFGHGCRFLLPLLLLLPRTLPWLGWRLLCLLPC